MGEVGEDEERGGGQVPDEPKKYKVHDQNGKDWRQIVVGFASTESGDVQVA